MIPFSTRLSSHNNNMSNNKLSLNDGDAMFGKFVIRSDCIFYRTQHSLAFVNLRPIVPGHVLIVSQRVAPRLQDLTATEYADVWTTVRAVQQILQQRYGAESFNVAVQDGRAAGQSVPHVHVHILPRTAGDFQRNDDVYQELEEWAPRRDMKQAIAQLDVPEDEQRRDRTPQEMAKEAETYRRIAETLKAAGSSNM